MLRLLKDIFIICRIKSILLLFVYKYNIRHLCNSETPRGKLRGTLQRIFIEMPLDDLTVSSTYALMNLDFPKRSARKILELTIPTPLGGRDKLHYVCSQRVSLNHHLNQVGALLMERLAELSG
jgi:hypothetical protein